VGVRRAVEAVVPLLLPLERPPHAAAAEAALQNLVLQPRHHRVDVDVVRALDDYALRAFEVDGVRPRLSRRKHAAADGGTVQAQPLAGPRRAPLAAGAASVALALPLAASPAGSPAATLDRRRGRGRVRRRRRRRRSRSCRSCRRCRRCHSLRQSLAAAARTAEARPPAVPAHERGWGLARAGWGNAASSASASWRRTTAPPASPSPYAEPPRTTTRGPCLPVWVGALSARAFWQESRDREGAAVHGCG